MSTRAYAVGLGGIYLNLEGRESQGRVKVGEEEQSLKRQIRRRLSEICDRERDRNPVAEIYDSQEVYDGPYKDEGPDLIVGLKPGYRVSWKSSVGAITERIFDDNERSWSGDHCLNPPDVPGVFFCNKKITAEKPSIMDIGPTVLDLFGVPVPRYCDGKSLLPAPPEALE